MRSSAALRPQASFLQGQQQCGGRSPWKFPLHGVHGGSAPFRLPRPQEGSWARSTVSVSCLLAALSRSLAHACSLAWAKSSRSRTRACRTSGAQRLCTIAKETRWAPRFAAPRASPSTLQGNLTSSFRAELLGTDSASCLASGPPGPGTATAPLFSHSPDLSAASLSLALRSLASSSSQPPHMLWGFRGKVFVRESGSLICLLALSLPCVSSLEGLWPSRHRSHCSRSSRSAARSSRSSSFLSKGV